MGPTDQSYQMQLEAPLRLPFSPDGSGTPNPVPKLVQDLDVQTDNVCPPSAQCTEAANKSKWLIFMIRRSFQDLSKSAFILLYGALVRPHLEYGRPACSPNLVACINHLERIQRIATRLVTGMRNLPNEETAAAGPSFLAAATISGWPSYRLQNIHGPFGYWSELIFPPPARRGLRGQPYKVVQGTSHRRRREGCEILE